ncbi:MAG TPA: PadR family transcriptional regulator [Ktedonobacterales bacterium]|nr:PadR family transcriptional regulator [Ktedonobacterales bacterium]
MPQRKLSNPLALAVLACLAERPMHPYEMATTLRGRKKDESIKLNYGSLYTVVESLLRHGLILPQETEREGRRPERTVYRITDAGEAELREWVAELLRTPVNDYTQFAAGLSFLPALPPDEAVEVLRQRCISLELAIVAARSMLGLMAAHHLPRLFAVEEEYRLALREAELAWTRHLVGEIADGGLSGTKEWANAYASGNPGELAFNFDLDIDLTRLVEPPAVDDKPPHTK